MHVEDVCELGKKLVAHFTFEAGEIPPTLSDYRRRVGLSLSAYRALLEDERFSEAARDARARYLDTLTVGALLKKYDAGFVKYLLDAEEERAGEERMPEELTVEVRVVE